MSWELRMNFQHWTDESLTLLLIFLSMSFIVKVSITELAVLQSWAEPMLSFLLQVPGPQECGNMTRSHHHWQNVFLYKSLQRFLYLKTKSSDTLGSDSSGTGVYCTLSDS